MVDKKIAVLLSLQRICLNIRSLTELRLIKKQITLKNTHIKGAVLTAFIFSTTVAHAQGTGALSTGFIGALIVMVLLLLVGTVIFVGDSLIGIEAEKQGIDKDVNLSIFPKFSELFGKPPAFLPNGGSVTQLKKGYDIPLAGAPANKIVNIAAGTTYSLKPKDFVAMSPIPKILKGEGEEVKAGEVLFFDKKRPEIKYSSPVSGEIVSIVRGEKRSINNILILADKEQKYREYKAINLADCKREDLVEFLLESGVWPFIRQRPYDIVADPKDHPKAIFISTYDSAPLAPNLNLAVEGQGHYFQKGLDVLNHLTEGTVHLGLNANGTEPPSSVFTEATGVQKNWFSGPHPSGNVGIQIHHTDPIAKGDVIWVMNPQDVLILGRLFVDRVFNTERLVAVSGAELKETFHVKAKQGANIQNFVANNLIQDHVRFLAGDVLTGKKIDANGYLGFFDDQITVLHENDNYEMFGWLLGMTPRATISKSYPKGLYEGIPLRAETNTHGEPRAFVVSGQYESVLPMDLYPQFLFKSIIFNDFEQMEGLGIYELVPEDVALCEFACTSKQDLQNILAQGLEVLREQG